MSSMICPFCLEFKDVESSDFRMLFREDTLKSRVINSTLNFVVLAGLGAIRPGYVLILPQKHVLSFAFLDKDAANEADKLKADLIRRMAPLFSNLIVFEHGPIIEKASRGGCIDHAHLHIFPTSIDLFPRLAQEFDYKRVNSVRDLAYFRKNKKHYIYYERAQEGFAFEINRPIPSQYVRRLLWEAEDRPDEWDWGAFIGCEHIVDTVKLLGQIPEVC